MLITPNLLIDVRRCVAMREQLEDDVGNDEGNALSRFSDVIFESRSCQTYVVRTPPVVFVLKPEISLRSNPLHVVFCEDWIVRDNGQRFDLRLRDRQPVNGSDDALAVKIRHTCAPAQSAKSSDPRVEFGREDTAQVRPEVQASQGLI